MAGLPGVQALDDDAPSVTIAESLGRTDCAGWRAWLGTTTRKDLLNRAWVDREVHKDRMVWASDSFRPPAPKVRARDGGPIDRTMARIDHSYFY